MWKWLSGTLVHPGLPAMSSREEVEEGVGGSLCFVQTGAASPVATHSPVISCLALVPESGATYSLSLPLFHRALHRSLHPPPLLYILQPSLHPTSHLSLHSQLTLPSGKPQETVRGEDGRKIQCNHTKI